MPAAVDSHVCYIQYSIASPNGCQHFICLRFNSKFIISLTPGSQNGVDRNELIVSFEINQINRSLTSCKKGIHSVSSYFLLFLWKAVANGDAQDNKLLFIISSNLHFISSNCLRTKRWRVTRYDGKTQLLKHMFQRFYCENLNDFGCSSGFSHFIWTMQMVRKQNFAPKTFFLLISDFFQFKLISK